MSFVIDCYHTDGVMVTFATTPMTLDRAVVIFSLYEIIGMDGGVWSAILSRIGQDVLEKNEHIIGWSSAIAT